MATVGSREPRAAGIAIQLYRIETLKWCVLAAQLSSGSSEGRSDENRVYVAVDPAGVQSRQGLRRFVRRPGVAFGYADQCPRFGVGSAYALELCVGLARLDHVG